MTNRTNEYDPDYVSAPGETLAEAMESRQLTQVDLAQRIGISRKHVKDILTGTAPIVPDTALRLERALGIPARFWNERERNYREFLARNKEKDALNDQVEWLSNFKHYSRMVSLGWVSHETTTVGKMRAILNYFGVASPNAWDELWQTVEVQYRRAPNQQSDQFALAAWLRKGELMAQDIECEPFDQSGFKEALREARKLTVFSPEKFTRELERLCASCGVAVVFVPELPKTASGATRWVSPVKAVIQLSLRYKTNDHLWFTFFHEAAHILLHPKKDIFIETTYKDSPQEEEANNFAADFLIPRKEFMAFVDTHRTFKKSAIKDFAYSQGIAPGIVVGQLQHAGKIPHSHCNDLKVKLVWGTYSN